jgi:tetratricopeptide (TPR) repeat protein
MLETIRSYALERLKACGESAAFRDKHLAYYLDLAQRAAPHSKGMKRWAHPDLLRGWEAERENLRLATQWALDQGRGETVVQMCSALAHFWYVSGQPGEVRQWLETALSLDLPKTARTNALALIGYVLSFMQIDYRSAQAFYEQALDLCRGLGEDESVSDLLCQMGTLMMEQGEYERARLLHEESLSTCEKLGDEDAAAGVRECLGVVLMRQGELDRAEEIFQGSLKWWQAHHEELATAFAYNYLGAIAMYRGSYAQAQMMHEQALALYERAGDTRGISATLNALGPVALYQGQVEQAQSLLKQSLRLRWDCLDYDGIAWNLERLAEVAVVQGHLERGGRLWGSADELRKSINSPLFPVERIRIERFLAGARAQFGESNWALAHSAGHQTAIEQIVAYALEG